MHSSRQPRERGVEGLLANPQTLKMLADVVAQGGGWPKSRKETFERACDQMVREHNEEHQAAQESNTPPAPDQLLDAAGRLCAVQLISGVAGFTLRGQTDEDYPAPDQCDYDRREVLRSALVTKLFKGPSNNRIPVHRHIAEFLGARHLAQIIERDIPARRVIALIAGEDGTVVTEMRGCVRLARGPLQETSGRTLSNAILSASGYTATSASSPPTRNTR